MRSWIARHLVYPVQERALRRPTFDMLKGLEISQRLSRTEIERVQMRKLTTLLQTALAHSPWHAERIRAAGLEGDVQQARVALSDLPRLPTMTKRDARLHVDRIVWPAVPGGAHAYSTGGSSGEPLIFYYGRDRQASDAAGRMRARRWWGVEVGDREVYLWGAPVELSKTDRIRTLRDRLINQLVLNAFEMSPVQMDAYLESIAAWRPRCIYGYASSIALLAAHADARGRRLRLPDLRVVCTTGEPLYPHQRALIEQVFDAPAANEFGSRDIGFTAHETPEGQMLLLSENVILEVLDADGHPVAPGDTGEAVMTALTSSAQPFIRYRTGDLLRLSRVACRRGTGLHVVDDIVGRQTDFIVRSDGTIMHALAVIYVLRSVDGVDQFKCIQLGPRVIQVLIVPGQRWSEASGEAVVSGLRARLGTDVEVEVKLQDAIPAEASGKHRYVVSHVPLAADLQRAAA
jgi:phenylacetate-CoA ligase